MSTFQRDQSGIHWITSSGPVRLSDDTAMVLSSLLLSDHDALMREGDREGARAIRKLWLELDEALGDLGSKGSKAA